MTEDSRTIASIVFCDLAAGGDALAAQRDVVQQYGGQWQQESAAGVYCTFHDPVSAVGCAAALQHDLAEHGLRIGVQIGKVVLRRAEHGVGVFGDAADVAARLQATVAPGGIVVTDRVHDALRGSRSGIELRYVEDRELKNVNRPIPVYEVVPKPGAAADKTLEVPRAVAVEPPPARRPWLFPVVGAFAAAAIAAVAALLLSGEPEVETVAPPTEEAATAPPTETEEAAPIEAVDEEPATGPVPEEPPAVSPAIGFASLRKRLSTLEADGTLAPRLWTVPDPVKDGSHYQVGFVTSCDCTARVFSISGSDDEIMLLFPNIYQPQASAAAEERVLVPEGPDPPFTMTAVGGEGIDVLKLVVVEGETDFPADRGDVWMATPDRPDRLAELSAWLDELEAGGLGWGIATAPLQIVP